MAVTIRSSDGAKVTFQGVETGHDRLCAQKELELLFGGTWTATEEPETMMRPVCAVETRKSGLAEHFAEMVRTLARSVRPVPAH